MDLRTQCDIAAQTLESDARFNREYAVIYRARCAIGQAGASWRRPARPSPRHPRRWCWAVPPRATC